jgi:hypothetical protein
MLEEESTRTVMSALREVIGHKGLFCALYSDPALRHIPGEIIKKCGR